MKNRKKEVKGNPTKNLRGKQSKVMLTAIIALALIVWLIVLAHNAKKTVAVVMINQEVPKGSVAITEDMLSKYDMNYSEFQKFSIVDSNGKPKRRIVLWDERNILLGTYAAYPLHKDTYAEYRSFINSRVDNADSVLYSFPGKDTIQLNIDSSELQAFKTFLQPGDRINVTATYMITEEVDNGYGSKEKVETVKVKEVFKDIMIADMINSNGQSVLDIYEAYKNMTVREQQIRDADATFQKSVEPKALLVALTPEELEEYYQVCEEKNIEFHVSLPQRME